MACQLPINAVKKNVHSTYVVPAMLDKEGLVRCLFHVELSLEFRNMDSSLKAAFLEID
jgi:hypothetical protein